MNLIDNLLKDYKPPTEKQRKANKLKQLQSMMRQIPKRNNFAYQSAIERNKKNNEYKQYLLRVKAEISPTKQHEIIADYLNRKK